MSLIMYSSRIRQNLKSLQVILVDLSVMKRSEINENLAFLHFLGEKRLTKVDFVIVLGRVFHNVLFSACLFCLLKAFVYDAVWIIYFVENRSAIITKNESK